MSEDPVPYGPPHALPPSGHDLSPAAVAWLTPFPVRHHSLIEAWFRRGVQQGATTPSEVLIKVTVLLGQKLEWSVAPESRQLCNQALLGLRCRREDALRYAQTILQEEPAP